LESAGIRKTTWASVAPAAFGRQVTFDELAHVGERFQRHNSRDFQGRNQFGRDNATLLAQTYRIQLAMTGNAAINPAIAATMAAMPPIIAQRRIVSNRFRSTAAATLRRPAVARRMLRCWRTPRA
jgi:hypothetical protein